MRWIKRGILVLVALILVPVALLVVIRTWTAFERQQFYRARPVLGLLDSVHNGIWTNDSGPAREAFLRHLPLGTTETITVETLKREGFGCQQSSMKFNKGTNCQLLAPAGFGYTRWIVDLDFDGSKTLSDVRIAVWNIFL